MGTKIKNFRKEFERIVKKFKGTLISSDLCEVYEFETLVGNMRVTIYEDEKFEFIPIIFTENFDLEKFMGITFDETINPYSYKWNLHSSDAKFNLSRLHNRIRILTEK